MLCLHIHRGGLETTLGICLCTSAVGYLVRGFIVDYKIVVGILYWTWFYRRSLETLVLPFHVLGTVVHD